MIIVIWVFVPAGTVFVVEVDLEPKVEALLFSFQHFHCLHMLLTLMVCSVTGFAYPATAVVPCVECSFSNTIGLHPWLLANAPYNCNGPWTSKSLCQPPDNQSDEASCPQRTLSAGSDKGSSTRDNSAPPDPCKHHQRRWCFCTSSLDTLAALQGLLLCAPVLPNFMTATLWAEMHASCC